MKFKVLMLLILNFNNVLFSQESRFHMFEKESLSNLKDEIIKSEILNFYACDSVVNEVLIMNEIPIQTKNKTEMNFNMGTFFSSNYYININKNYLNSENPKYKFIEFIYNNSVLYFPDSAFTNILEPIMDSCKTFLPRVYCTKNKKRFYIHMFFKIENNTYQVVWCIENLKYKFRIIDEK